MSQKHLAGRFLLSTMLSGIAAAAAVPAFAQDSDHADGSVPGTRITRADLNTSNAVVSISAENLEITNSVNIEGILHKLPQVLPTLSANTNIGNPGAVTLNLRGIGDAHTLVLMDGMRLVSFDGGGAVDINMIPAALISQVDIITGGASAVYGSDAIAGVVNFRTKKDFEGLELNTSYETTEKGGGDIFNVDIVAGGNFGDGRGNAVVYAGYTNRNPVLQGDRVLFENAPVLPSPFFPLLPIISPTSSVGVPTTRLFSFIGSPGGFDWTAAGLFTPGACPEGLTDTGAACLGDATFTDGGALTPWIGSGPNNTRFDYAPFNLLQTPQERYYTSGFATYEIGAGITAHVKGLFSQNTNPQQRSPAPFFSTVVIQENNPFLPADALTLLATNGFFSNGDSDGDGFNDGTVFIGRRLLENGPSITNTRRNAFQMQVGLEGDFNFMGDGASNSWGWDVTGAFGRSTSDEALTGDYSVTAFQDLVRTNQMDIFSLNSITQANVDVFTRTGISVSENEQTQIIGTVHGDGGHSPWAEAPAAWVFGFEYRELFNIFQPDSHLIFDVVRFNNARPSGGRYDVYEGFMETNIPVVQNMPFMHDLSFNGAYRYSEYSTAGSAHSFALGASWTPDRSEQIRFRGQFQRAVRAPNISELFSPQSMGFPRASDPCSMGPNGNFETFTGAEQAIIRASCIAEGVPDSFVGTNFMPSSQIEGLFGGNPNLQEETANTITAGVIVQPHVAPGLTLQVDYFNIDISDAIFAPRLQQILEDCHLGGDPVSCSLIMRQGGVIRSVQSTLVNIAGSKTTGIDFNFNYNLDPSDFWGDWNAGAFVLDFNGTLLMKDESQVSSVAPAFDAAGLHGNFTPRAKWSHFTSVTWSKGPFGLYGDWQYIGAATSNRSQLDDLNTYSLFSMAAFFEVNEHARLTFGIDNLLDKDLQLIGEGSSSNPNTYVSLYDPLGRKFYGALKLKF